MLGVRDLLPSQTMVLFLLMVRTIVVDVVLMMVLETGRLKGLEHARRRLFLTLLELMVFIADLFEVI